MDHKSAEDLPIYYQNHVGHKLPFLPFMIAPVGEFQDTLIVGPESVAGAHDEFINKLYGQISSHKFEGMAVRAFIFNSMLTVAVLLPTSLKDETERGGLALSIGFFIKGNAFRLRSSVIPEYLRIYMQALNRTFSLSLPSHGADKLLQAIRDSHDGSSIRQEVVTKIRTVLDSLSLAATAVGEVAGSFRRWAFLRLRRKRKLPRAIFYQAGADYEEILRIFFKELDRGISRTGRTGVQQPFGKTEGMDVIALLPLAGYLTDARGTKLKRHRGKSYLNIY